MWVLIGAIIGLGIIVAVTSKLFDDGDDDGPCDGAGPTDGDDCVGCAIRSACNKHNNK